ncbi:Uncharacterized protein FWK35_00012375 [Aphis craccivora]|uniref:FLYWCH-type domain-containing protein n=1 Tax=Aphis craccivora TaxID=307492 RepID=A0A6G0YWD4_APHCR|nr:Uncharacterized protein FWK35_00012375 [Aphis craccivora]
MIRILFSTVSGFLVLWPVFFLLMGTAQCSSTLLFFQFRRPSFFRYILLEKHAAVVVIAVVAGSLLRISCYTRRRIAYDDQLSLISAGLKAAEGASAILLSVHDFKDAKLLRYWIYYNYYVVLICISMRSNFLVVVRQIDKKDITISKLHGKIKLGYQNFLFVFQKPVKNGKRWVCIHKNLCNGSITTDNDLKHSHNHETNTVVLEAELAICKMKQDAKENLNLPSRIYAKMKKIPIENNLKRSLRRIRIFASHLCLKSLSSSKHITFMDGTFATCSQGFFQVPICCSCSNRGKQFTDSVRITAKKKLKKPIKKCYWC